MAFYALDADRRFSDGPPTFRRVAMSRSSSEAEFEMLSPGDPLHGLRRVIAVGPVHISAQAFRTSCTDLPRRTSF